MKFKHFFLTALSLIALSTSCYKEELDDLQKQIDELSVSSLEEQVAKMLGSVKDLQALQDQIAPAVENLQKTKAELEESIAKLQAQISATDSVSFESQAQLISQQAQLDRINSAVQLLTEADLDNRIKALYELVKTGTAGLDARVTTLENVSKTFATLEQLAKIQAVVDEMSASFDQKFIDAVRGCKDEIIAWVSESQQIKDLFLDYYTKEEIDAFILTLVEKNFDQDDEINAIKQRITTLDTDLRTAIDDAVKGVTKHFEDEVKAIDEKIAKLTEDYGKLEARVTSLEKLYDVVGDFSNYRSNLIADVLALQKILGTGDEDGTLTSLVNTLKLVLTESEGKYFDLHKIVADIAVNADSLQSQDSRIAALDAFVKTLASIESLTKLGEDVEQLRQDIATNKKDIETLTQRVDAIVQKWTEDVYKKITDASADIIKLKEEDATIWLAIGVNTEGSETGIYGLIADINETIAGLKISELWTNVEDINELLKNCGVNGVTGLQNNLNDLDRRIKELWSVIGDYGTLSIQGSIINAINVIDGRFGNIGDKTIEAIIAGLEADLAVIRGAGWGATEQDSVSLAELKAITDNLNVLLNSKSDTATVARIQEAVAIVQETIVGIITESNADEKLAAWIKKAAADTIYATIKDLNDFLALYKRIVGDEDNIAEGTVLYKLNVLNTIAGDGQNIGEGGWAATLTDAVNKLHALVGEDTVSKQVNTIASGLIQDLVNAILGGEGTAKDIADTLVSYYNNINTLYSMIGDFSKVREGSIAENLACINEILDKLDEDYAAKEHSHTTEDIEFFADAVNDLIKAITGDLTALKTKAKDTLVDAINELYDKFAQYYTDTQVDSLLTLMELTLSGAIVHGDTGWFKTLNFDALYDEIQGIIKKDGAIDTTVRNAIELLNIEQYLSQDELKALNYISHDQLDTAVVLAYSALKLNIWGYDFNYANIDEAIVMVYDSLAKYIHNYDLAMEAFNTLETRVDNVEKLIGGNGFFNADHTIYSVVDSLTRLFGQLGDGTSVKDLIDGLSGVDTLIVNAVLGKSSTDWAGDFGNLNLLKLKERLDTLGFTNVTDGTHTLKEVLDSLSDDISELAATIGGIGTGKFNPDSTIAATLKALHDSLGTFSKGQYDEQIGSLQSQITELIDTLAGKSGGTIHDVNVLVSHINHIQSQLDALNIKGKTELKDILENLDSRLDSICVIVGDTTGLGFASLSEALKALYDKVTSDAYWQERLKNSADAIQNLIGVKSLVDRIGSLDSLKTGKKSSIVDAINWTYAQVQALKSEQESYATLEALLNLKHDIVWGHGQTAGNESDITYPTIKALSDALKALVDAIGTKPEDETKTVYQSIENLYEVLDSALGERPEEYQDKSVWEAIAELKAIVDNATKEDLMFLLRSIVYIPEYSDGKAVVSCNKARTSFADLSMDFAISASAKFKTQFEGGKYKAYGLVSSVNTRQTKAPSEERLTVKSAVISNDGTKLSVVFSRDTLASKMPKTGAAQIALALYEPATGEIFTSKYIAISFSEKETALDVNPAPCTFTFTAGVAGQSETVEISDIVGNGYVIDSTAASAFSCSHVGNTLTIKKNDEAAHTGCVVISAAGGATESYRYDLVEISYSLSIGDEIPDNLVKDVDTLTAKYGYEATYQVPIECEPEYKGSEAFSVSVPSDCKWITGASVDKSGILTFKLAENAAEERKEVITVSTTDGSNVSLNITVVQPALSYKITVGDASTGLTKTDNDGTVVLTAASGAAANYELAFTIEPALPGSDKFAVEKDGTIVTSAVVTSGEDGKGKLSFSVSGNNTGAGRDYTMKFYPKGYQSTATVSVKFVQPAVSYAITIGDTPTPSGKITKADDGVFRTVDGLKREYHIPFTIAPDYSGAYTVTCTDSSMVESMEVKKTEGGKYVSVTLKDNTSGLNPRQTSFTFAPEGMMDVCPATFTVEQPRISYSFKLGAVDALSGLTRDSDNTLKTKYGNARDYIDVPIVCLSEGETVEYKGGFTVSEDSDWISNAEVNDNKLKFTVAANNGAERSAAITLTSKVTGDTFVVTVIQNKLVYSLKVVEIPGTFTANADTSEIAANNFLGGTFSGIRIGSEPEYKSSNYDIVVEAGVTWLKNVSIDESGIMKFDLDTNKTSAERRARVTFKPAGSGEESQQFFVLVQPKLFYTLRVDVSTVPSALKFTYPNKFASSMGFEQPYSGIRIVCDPAPLEGFVWNVDNEEMLQDVSVTDEGLLSFTMTASAAPRREGKITVSPKNSENSLELSFVQTSLSYTLTLRDVLSDTLNSSGTDAAPVLTTSDGAGRTYQGLHIDTDPNYFGDFVCEVVDPKVDGMIETQYVDQSGEFSFTLTDNESAERTSTIRVYPKGRSQDKLDITIVQPKLVYTFALDASACKQNNVTLFDATNKFDQIADASTVTLTTHYAAECECSVVVSSTPEKELSVKSYSGFEDIPSISGDKLNFTLGKVSANTDYSIVVKTAGDEASFTLVIKQQPYAYTFTLGDLSGSSYFTRSGNTYTTDYLKAQSGLSIPVTCTPTPAFGLSLTGNSGNFAGTPSLTDNKLNFDLPAAPSGDTYTLTVGADGNSNGVTATIKQVPTERTWTLKSWTDYDIYGNTKDEWQVYHYVTVGNEEDAYKLKWGSNEKIIADIPLEQECTIGTRKIDNIDTPVLSCSPACTYDNKYRCQADASSASYLSSCSYDGQKLTFKLLNNFTNAKRTAKINIYPDDGSNNPYVLSIEQDFARITLSARSGCSYSDGVCVFSSNSSQQRTATLNVEGNFTIGNLTVTKSGTSIDASYSSSNKRLTLVYSKDSKNPKRESIVTLTDPNTNFSVTITVKQN